MTLVAALAFVAACGDVAGSMRPAATSEGAAPAPTPSPSPSPAAWAPKRAPEALTASAAAGVITFDDWGERWRYDGAAGTIVDLGPRVWRPTRGTIATSVRGQVARIDASLHLSIDGSAALPDTEVTAVEWSPDGRLLALEVPPPAPLLPAPAHPEWMPRDLLVLDVSRDVTQLVYHAPLTKDDPATIPTMRNDWPETFDIATWSPDSRFIGVWLIDFVSGSADQDGRRLRLFDLSGASKPTDLGRTLLYPDWLAWQAPHTLAYVEGGWRFSDEGKRLRLWSPDAGAHDVTAVGETGIAPSWAPDGSLLFTAGPDGSYDPGPFFAGTGTGARRLYRYDPRTSTRSALPAAVGARQDLTRESRDGRARLELRQPLVAAPIPRDGAPPRCELWYVDAGGALALVRFRAPCYVQASYDAILGLEWSR